MDVIRPRLVVTLPIPSSSGISSTATHKSRWQPKRTSSWRLSASRPSRASPAKSATWCRSSTKSSWSPGMWRVRAPTPTSSSPSTAPTETQAGVNCGKSSATFLSEAARTASSWRCWTSGSYRGSRWSTTTAAPTAGGTWSAWRWQTWPTRWQQSSSAGSGWTLASPTGR